MIRAAGAQLVVFPELSLTGYELDAEVVSPQDEELGDIVAACTDTESVALVGAPIEGEDGTAHIGMLRASSAGVEIAYRKAYLGGDEPARFAPGDGPVVIDLEGWRVGVGLCKDTGVEQHVADMSALDPDLYVAGLVHFSDSETCRRSVASRSRAHAGRTSRSPASPAQPAVVTTRQRGCHRSGRRTARSSDAPESNQANSPAQCSRSTSCPDCPPMTSLTAGRH